MRTRHLTTGTPGAVLLLRTLGMSSTIRRSALIYDARLAYYLKVITGVAAYLRESPNYNVYIEENALKNL